MIVCGGCGAEVFWALPRPEDTCPTCGERIGKKPAAEYPMPLRRVPVGISYLAPRGRR